MRKSQNGRRVDVDNAWGVVALDGEGVLLYVDSSKKECNPLVANVKRR